MSDLTRVIENLVGRPGVNGQEVRNYLGALEWAPLPRRSDLMAKLRYDAYFFRWSSATTEAVKAGIEVCFNTKDW